MPRAFVILVVACLCAQALAQEDEAQKRRQTRIFSDMTLREAMEESERTKRLLVVYPHGLGEAYRQMGETTWRSPTLREWMLWHGIAIKVDVLENPQDYRMLPGGGASVGGTPRVLVFKGNCLVLTIPDGRTLRFDRQYPSMLEVLMALDVYMDGQITQDPVWLMGHKLKNPMPPPPPLPPPLFETEDEGAAAFREPEGGADVLGVLDEARGLREDGGAVRRHGPLHVAVGAGAADRPGVRAGA